MNAVCSFDRTTQNWTRSSSDNFVHRAATNTGSTRQHGHESEAYAGVQAFHPAKAPNTGTESEERESEEEGSEDTAGDHEESKRQENRIIDPSREHDWPLDTAGSSGKLYYHAVSTYFGAIILYLNFDSRFSSIRFIIFISQVWSKMDIMLEGKGKRELAAIRTKLTLCIAEAYK